MHIKSTVRRHLTPIRVPTSKKQKTKKQDETNLDSPRRGGNGIPASRLRNHHGPGPEMIGNEAAGAKELGRDCPLENDTMTFVFECCGESVG